MSMATQPALIGVTRYFSEYETDEDGNRDGGWRIWVTLSEGNDPSDFYAEYFFRTKKDAMAWRNKRYPDVKVNYVTNATRRAS